jgi:hypothetical protein
MDDNYHFIPAIIKTTCQDKLAAIYFICHFSRKSDSFKLGQTFDEINL